MKLTNFQQTLLKSLAPYLGVILILIIAIFVLRSNINSRIVKINMQRSAVNSRVETVKSLADLRSEEEKTQVALNFLNNTMPTRDQAIIFSKKLEDIAKKDLLGFGFTFGTETKSIGNEPGAIAFRISLQGPYNNFINFLRDVESSGYMVNFSNFDLSKRGDSYDVILGGQVFTQ